MNQYKEEYEGGWIGVDLDGTLARYDGWKGPEHIGEPLMPMVERVKAWLAEGREVRIMTARVSPDMPGMTRSRKIREGFLSRAARRPASPPSAVITGNPASMRASLRNSRTHHSSSTTRTGPGRTSRG